MAAILLKIDKYAFEIGVYVLVFWILTANYMFLESAGSIFMLMKVFFSEIAQI